MAHESSSCARGLRDEFAQARQLLSRNPEAGLVDADQPEGTRRLLLPGTSYFVYYAVDHIARELRILSVWHTSRVRPLRTSFDRDLERELKEPEFARAYKLARAKIAHVDRVTNAALSSQALKKRGDSKNASIEKKRR